MDIVDLIYIIKNSDGYKAFKYIHTGENITKTKIESSQNGFSYYEEAGKNYNYNGYINFTSYKLTGIINYKNDNKNYYKVVKYEDNLNSKKSELQFSQR